MLSKLGLRPEQIHRIKGEEAPEAAAADYESEITRCFGLSDGELPHFDLVLLGLGYNAHTASLFPGSPALDEEHRLVVAVEVEAEERHRVTLTARVINAAARVMFLVSGENKARAVKEIFEGPQDAGRFPAQLVKPADGDLIWLLDKAAASLLSQAS
jgi:6-phosphogluconolactonase